MTKTNILMSKTYSRYGSNEFKEANTRDWVCSSCGVRAVNLELKSPRNSLLRLGGIKVAAGAFGEDFDNGKVDLKVINTKNGPLTVAARYVF